MKAEEAAQKHASQANQQLASISAARGSLALERLERDLGATLLVRAFKTLSGEISSESLGWLFEAGDAWRHLGNSSSASVTFQMASAAAQALLRDRPRDRVIQCDLSISYEKIGDVQEAQGNSSAALKNFQEALALRLII